MTSGPFPASRFAYVLLGLMTLLSFGGPLLIMLILWSGGQPDWPPDRPVEWVGVGVIFVLVFACFIACLTAPWWIRRKTE